MEGSPVNSVLMRKTEFGDFDYILTYFTKEMGNISLVAKNAKKSMKRFSGKLELYTNSIIHFVHPKKGGLPLITEVLLEKPYENIRKDILRTSYAAYWAELITFWIPAENPQVKIYELLINLLGIMNKSDISPGVANLYFQIHFLKLAGFDPMLKTCSYCGRKVLLSDKKFKYSLDKGGLICGKCIVAGDGLLSAANLKQILWIRENCFDIAFKLKFSRESVEECSLFLNRFISYNTERDFRSQKIIRYLQL
ncbi:MAG: DNA repair protein RecO [Deltaproteobacteria bacterium]|nr:MAG: DNA repair protein RecO [Deltaproteobacteria bacterium]